MTGRLAGKVALVTGGASGLGEAIVRRFRAEGGLIVIADINRPRAQELVAEIGGDTSFVEANVADDSSVAMAVDAVLDRHGRIDVMVNNAGIGGRPGADLAAWWRLFGVDLLGVAWGTRHAVRAMAPAGGGAIVNIGSHAGQRGCRTGAYGAAKAAAHTLMRYTSLMHGPDGIRANAVLPGNIFTTIHDRARQDAIARYVDGDAGAFATDPLGTRESGDTEEEVLEEFRRRHPMGRLAQPIDIANAALFLASDEAIVATGNEFMSTGGILPARLQRRLLAAAEFSDRDTLPPPPGGGVAVVSGNGPISEAVAARLDHAGASPLIAPPEACDTEEALRSWLGGLGTLAGIVFVASPDPGGTLLTQDAETWRSQLTRSVRLPEVIGELAGAAVEPGGSVTFISDAAGSTGAGGSPAFCAASAALAYSTDELADVLRPAGIRVNGVVAECTSRPVVGAGLGAPASPSDIAEIVVGVSRGTRAITGAQVSLETSHP